jgi:superfamily II DNA or RNA helicase
VEEDTIKISRVNEVYMRVNAEPGILQEIKEAFTFEIPNAKYNPKVKMRIWDGKISLLNIHTKQMYTGLYFSLKEFAESRGYAIDCDDQSYINGDDVSPKAVFDFVKGLNLHSDGKPIQVRDYQLVAIWTAIKHRRRTLLSPTASGKSLIIYCTIRWILEKTTGGTALLIVPNIGLVRQMFSDFEDYSSHNGFDVNEMTQTISEGADKKIIANIVISTWQSIYKQPIAWFNQLDGILCDEVHLAQATSIKEMMEKATEVKYRVGLTGTLGDAKTHEWVITGLFGKVTRVATTAELIEKGQIADIAISCLVLDYEDKNERKLLKEVDYSTELDYICGHEKRNILVAKMAIESKGNTLVLFNFVEKHGKLIHELILKMLAAKGNTTRKVFFIHGSVKGTDRDLMRAIVEKEEDAIIIASYGTMSTGTNIKRIHNIIFASPFKSVIRLLQSIGRGLRMAEGKTKMNLIDIVDDFSGGNKKKNFTFNHFIERLRHYTEEKFEYKIVKIKI